VLAFSIGLDLIADDAERKGVGDGLKSGRR
jgi:hypothetical protein